MSKHKPGSLFESYHKMRINEDVNPPWFDDMPWWFPGSPPVLPKYGVPGGGLFLPGDFDPSNSNNPLINDWWDVFWLNVGYWWWGDHNGDGVPDAPGTDIEDDFEIDPDTGLWDNWPWDWGVPHNPWAPPGLSDPPDRPYYMPDPPQDPVDPIGDAPADEWVPPIPGGGGIPVIF